VDIIPQRAFDESNLFSLDEQIQAALRTRAESGPSDDDLPVNVPGDSDLRATLDVALGLQRRRRF